MNTTIPGFYRLAAIGAALLLSLAITRRSEGQQQNPPAPSAPRPVRIPAPRETTLPNGLRVIVVQQSGIPLVSARLLLKSGAEADPSGESGLSAMTAELLTKGTASRSAPEIAQAVESLGGTLESGAGWDLSDVYVNVMSSKLEQALPILSDVVRHPAFKPDEIERLRRQTLDSIEVDLHEPSALASMTAMRVVFGGQPYGHPVSGTLESVRKITREDILNLQQKYYRPDNAVLVMGGDVTAQAGFDLARRLFADWAKPAAPLTAAAQKEVVPTSTSRRVVLVDMPEAGQAAVAVAMPGIKRSDPDYFTGIVANSVLGGGYSARLNQEIRIKRGLSYGAGSRLEARRDTGPFVAATQTKNESAAEVAELMLSELSKLQSEPIPDSELTPRKAVLIGNFSRSLETTDGLVAQIGSLAVYGIALDQINRYIEEVQAVTSTRVQQFARDRLNPAQASVIIVGNGKLMLEDVRKRFPGVRVIPLADLDLNQAGLGK